MTQLRRAVESGIQATAALEGVADAANRLFEFHPEPDNDAKRFYGGALDSEFAQDVSNLHGLLRDVRSRRAHSMIEWQHVNDLTRVLRQDLTGTDSPLIKALVYYLVDVREVLLAVAPRADDRLRQEGKPQGWTNLVERTVAAPIRVLGHPIEIRELISNLFTNVRHSLARGGKFSVDLRILREEARPESADPDDADHVVVRINLPVQPFQIPADSTLARQRQQIEQYGGGLFVELGRDGCEIALRLISRERLWTLWQARTSV